MTEHLFLRLGVSRDGVEALVLSQDGRLLRQVAQMPLTGAASLAEGRRVHVMVPSDQLVLLSAEIPRTSANRVRSLLPYSLEDQFATEIEELHFAVGPVLPDGATSAAVVERERLEGWLDQLVMAGIRPHAVYAECDGVPDTPSTVAFVLGEDCVLGRCPGETAFRLDDLALPELWTLLNSSGDSEPPRWQHVMIYGSGQALAAQSSEIQALRALVDDVDVREVREGISVLLAARLINGTGTNLLQGEYAPKSNIRAALRPWYAAAGVAAALALIVTVASVVDLVRLTQADTALSEQTRTLCSAQFGVTLASACRAEVQRRLADAGQTTSDTPESFLSALTVVADSADAAAFEALSFRNRTLDLDLRVANVEALDRFVQEVAGTERFEARPLSNTPEDDGLRSRVQVVMTSP